MQARWIMIRMDMLRRLIGPWGKGASKEQRQAWRREYDALAKEETKLNNMLYDGKTNGLVH